MRTYLMLLAGLALLSCTGKKPSGQSHVSADTAEAQVVEQKLKTYYADMSRRDWEKYRGHFWKNATITTTWLQPGDSAATVDVTTIDDFIKETPDGPDSKPIFEETMKDSQIKVQGSIAGAWVRYDARFGTQDSLMRWSGTDVFTLLKHNGEWRIVSLVFESDH